MKTDDTSNSKPSSCPLQRSLGRTFTLFVPTSNRKVESNRILKRLVQQFDYVKTIKAENCSTPAKCQHGVQAEALRRDHKEGSEQDYSDTALVLKLVHDDLRITERVQLLDINNDINIYSLKCVRTPDS